MINSTTKNQCFRIQTVVFIGCKQKSIGLWTTWMHCVCVGLKRESDLVHFLMPVYYSDAHWRWCNFIGLSAAAVSLYEPLSAATPPKFTLLYTHALMSFVIWCCALRLNFKWTFDAYGRRSADTSEKNLNSFLFRPSITRRMVKSTQHCNVYLKVLTWDCSASYDVNHGGAKAEK